jgi:hypothetical protein
MFLDELNAAVVLAFMSGYGMYLGHTVVPFEEFWNGQEWVRRTPEDVRAFFERGEQRT